MPLNIRDPRAQTLARELADRRGVTMTQAIISALEAELKREREAVPLEERIMARVAALQANNGPNPQPVTKEDIDAWWGQ